MGNLVGQQCFHYCMTCMSVQDMLRKSKGEFACEQCCLGYCKKQTFFSGHLEGGLNSRKMTFFSW